MKKKFYIGAAILLVSTAFLSVFFSIVYMVADMLIESNSWVVFFMYVKKFFDLLAVFTGYGTVMYAFTRYDLPTGLKATGLFGISVGISFIYQIIGTYLTFDAESVAGTTDVSFILFVIFYACGSCFITQFAPAILIAFLTHILTKNGTSKKTLNTLRLIVSGIITGINIIVYICFDMIPYLIEEMWIVEWGDIGNIVLSIVEVIFFYFVIQFIMYYATHYLFEYIDSRKQLKEKD